MGLGDGTTWNENLPDDNTVANQIDDYNRDLRVGTRARLAREHIFPATQTATNEGGHHSFITFQAQTAPTLAGTTGGCLYVGASSAGYPLVFINSTGTEIVIVNSAGKLPIVTTGTLGGIPICSSANPNGLTVLAGTTSTTASTFMLVSVNDATGGLQAPTWLLPTAALVGPSVIGSSNVSQVFGAWDGTKSNNTVYQADSDGIVTAWASSGASGSTVDGYTDGSNPPTTQRAHCAGGSASAGTTLGITMPVRKGDYWKVTGADVVNWLPLGV